ncbi:uncharacterized protein [Amphiura filiformis]|uniref:uncharacterized protein n=1 Tax=Amphiura filiformis TaxID=82378 RepID=UPI003B21A35D
MARNNRVKRTLHQRKIKKTSRCSRLNHKNTQKLKKKHQEIERASAFITNLSDYELSDDQILALSKGLGFIPTPDKPSKNAIMRDCNDLIRIMRIRYHASLSKWPKRHKFRLPSQWQPGPTMCNDLEDFFENLKVELSEIPTKKVKPNYNPNEKRAWETLKKNTQIILKPYDKGRKKLSRNDQYLKLDYNPTKATADMLHSLACEMSTICRKTSCLQLLLFTGEGLRTHRLLPSTSGEIPTHLPEGYRGHHQEDRKLDSTLASLDMVSMFTSVPQDQAFRVTLETLANLDPFDYDPIIPDMKYMAELLRLVLYRNSFEFNDEYFLQTSGVPMGQRSSGSICNLVVHELENKILQSTTHIHTLYRYMDDTLVFWTGSLEDLQTFVQQVNTFHDTLKFTYEASEDTIHS